MSAEARSKGGRRKGQNAVIKLLEKDIRRDCFDRDGLSLSGGICPTNSAELNATARFLGEITQDGSTVFGKATIVDRCHGLTNFHAVPPDMRCSFEVAMTSSGYTFRGCRDTGITIAFDPNDPVYPFKGKSASSSEYKLKAK